MFLNDDMPFVSLFAMRFIINLIILVLMSSILTTNTVFVKLAFLEITPVLHGVKRTVVWRCICSNFNFKKIQPFPHFLNMF